MTYKDIKYNEEVNELLKKGNQNLGLLGYTDHSQAHCVRVAETAAHILKKFGYSEHDIELARIAGYMHDIGNAINRNRHAEYGGLLANEILKQYDLSIPDRIPIVSAISCCPFRSWGTNSCKGGSSRRTVTGQPSIALKIPLKSACW